MTDLINGVPRDRYGVWCQHGTHIMIADPADTVDWPALIPADPWPCTECTFEDYCAESEAAALAYEQERWDEWKASQ